MHTFLLFSYPFRIPFFYDIVLSQNRILHELQDGLRRTIQIKLLSRGVNPASLTDLDLNQFSSSDEDSDEVGSDSSADDGLPKHLEAIAAAK
ncbi:unnamed protein product, partial [Rotaria socialis]